MKNKTLKKLLSALLVVVMVLSSAPLNGFVGMKFPEINLPKLFDFCIEAEALTVVVSYTVEDGEATIIYCDNSASGDIIIPSTLGGYPVTSIGYEAFRDCDSLTSITIPNSVTSIGDGAFSDCDSLTSITIPNSVTSIGYDAFRNCDSLTSIIIPDSVTSIGYEAFYSCDSLTSITIPNSVTSIGNYAFSDCDSLTSITIPDSVTSMGNYAFLDCSSLTSITVDSNNPEYSSDEFGVLYNKDKTELIQYPIGNKRTGFTIPDSVTSIGGRAFYYCSILTSITIPISVTSIGDGAFCHCDSLTSITIPNSVTSIGDWAFSYSSILTSITIPDSVTSIGDYAFYICDSLTSITIGNSVTSIGDDTFYYCSSLTSITIPDSVTSIGSYAFSYCSSLTDVYYTGTEEAWNKISISGRNESLTNATIHFLASNDKFEVVEGSGATINEETKTIYGLEEGIGDLEGFVEYEGCALEYNPTAFGFGTGTTVDIVKDGEVVDTYTIVIFGDINGDGYVDAFDVPDVMNFVNYSSQYELGSPQEMAADISGDGFVDESDLFLADLASTFAYTIEQAR